MATPKDQGDNAAAVLAQPVALPCGLRLQNRLVKAAMSDSLGDGTGRPSEEQIGLYRRWANDGVGLSLIGEVQVDARFPEKPGNLVIGQRDDQGLFRRLADAGANSGSQLWPQLGHAGALAHLPISKPAGPSALDLDGLSCRELSGEEIANLPSLYAEAARTAKAHGFRGVEVHAGHGFLLSQFLSPLFNRRTDMYGGSVEARSQIVVDVVRAIREDVGPQFAIGVKINSSDGLDGGLTEADSLVAIERLASESVDLIDISGGTYFPGAPSSSDRASDGPYFVDFARRVRQLVTTPVMVTGGFKTRLEAIEAISTGAADVVGIARAFVIDPELTSRWLDDSPNDPQFPRFASVVPGGVTAWYTMRLTDLSNHREADIERSLEDAVIQYEARDHERTSIWNATFAF